METRRRPLLLAAGALLAERLGHAQQPQRMRRIGFLSPQSDTARRRQWWREGLLRAGYAEGRNLLIEWRFAEGQIGCMPGLADELVRLNVELIVTDANTSTDAARQVTQTIPIVMVWNVFPVERGLIKSLARPGGNVTGTVRTADPNEYFVKTWQILRDAVPKASRATILNNGADPILRFYDDAIGDQQAKEMGFISVQRISITRPNEITSSLDLVLSSRPDVLIVGAHVTEFGAFPEIAAFALERKLVSHSDSDRYVVAGGLLSYGPHIDSLRDLTGNYVDKILRGAKPADLPVQQTLKWNMVLNAKTAHAIGFKPPPAFKLQVTHEIE